MNIIYLSVLIYNKSPIHWHLMEIFPRKPHGFETTLLTLQLCRKGQSYRHIQIDLKRIGAFRRFNDILVGGFNQPIWRIILVKMGIISPIFGVKIKNLWNHHLVSMWTKNVIQKAGGGGNQPTFFWRFHSSPLKSCISEKDRLPFPASFFQG